MTRPLAGWSLAVLSADPAAGVCALHLERLGAGRVEADEAMSAGIVLTTTARSDPRLFGEAAVVAVFEEHELALAGLIASDATAQAALGFPDYLGGNDVRPDRTGSDIAASVTGFQASMAVMAQLFARRQGEPPAVIRTSMLRALSTLKSLTYAARLRPDDWTGTHVVSREKEPDSGYATADGWITLDFAEYAEAGWLTFVEELGLDAETVAALHPRWTQTMGWGDDIDAARPLYEARLRELSSADAMELIRRHGGQSVPFLTPEECLAHPQAEAVGLPASFESGVPFKLTARDGARVRPARHARAGELPLAGVRVVDFGIGGVGPFAPRLLAGLGADVVKVEPPVDFVHSIGPHVGGISTTYLACNNGKRSITANLKDPADRERIWELIAGADVINQNFRPGVLERLGFGFEDVAKVRPDIVYASTSGYGWDGPFAGEPCTDPHAQAFGGFAALNGEPGGPPYKIRYIGFIDVVTSTVIAEGICAALLLRDRQGGAVHMQTSMMHAVLESTRPAGPRLAPDGLFRCADGWVAVTCRDEAEWTRFVEVTGAAERLDRPELATIEERLRNRAALRTALDQVLGERAAHGWVLALTRAGIPCSRLIHDDEILIRRDYREHGFVTELLHGDRPPLAGGGEPVAMAGAVALRAPLPAEHDARFREAPGDFWLTPKARASADENFETTANSEGATHEL